MSVSYISSTSFDGASGGTVSTHQSGDLILAQGFRDGSNSTPTLPGGWTQLDTNTTNSAGAINAYKIAASSSETTGTWTNATEISVAVYRATNTIGVGAHAMGTGTASSVTYPGITMTGTYWVAAFAHHRSTDTSLGTAPAGMTNRMNLQQGLDEAAEHDTNGTVSSWSSTAVAVGGTASGWVASAIEITETVSGQTITAALVTNTQTFFGATLTTLTTITGGLFTNTQTFFGATITVNQTITGALFTNTNTFFGATVLAITPITGGLYTNPNTFFGATLTSLYTIQAGLYADPDTFFGATISGGASIPVMTTAKRAIWRRRRR